MRTFGSALVIAAGLTLLAGPALAQSGKKYPPKPKNLTVSESTVSPGERFTCAGDGAEPGATVTSTLKRSSSALGVNRSLAATPGLAGLAAAIRPQAQSSVPLGSTTANGDGQYTATLTIPSGIGPGVYTLTASSGGAVLAVVTIRVAVAGGVGDLAFTGGNVLPGLAIGASLIVAGGLLLLSLKRRPRAASM